jgi:hypothetical protein
MIRLTALLDDLSLTYRQLDYWIRTGRITLENPASGSGSRRWLTVAEANAIAALADEVAELRRRDAAVRSGQFFADRLASR